MAKKKETDYFPYFREIPDLKAKWSTFLALGVVLTVLGVLAILFAGWSTILTIELLGLFLLAGGFFQIVSGLQAREWTGVTLSLLLGILYIVIGAICIFKPEKSAIALTLLLAVFFFVSGLFRMAFSLQHRFDHRGLIFVSGLVSFILGVVIFAEWPVTGLWIIGLFVGIDLLFLGLNWILLSLAAKKGLR